MGAGKTTVGRGLAERLGWAWRDSDIDIEAATGLTVRALRDREGVTAMHEREHAHLLDALAAPGPVVISAAASVIDDPVCRAAMTKPGVLAVWLNASPETLAARFDSADEHRPAYGESPEAFLAEQAAQREPLAEALGALMVDVDDHSPDDAVARVGAAIGASALG